MTTRYLCKNHFHKFSQDLDSANMAWGSSISQGIQSLDDNRYTKAQRCFGAAYEISQIILDRTITSQCHCDIAANTLLSAQYLASALVYMNETEQAAKVLNHIHEKFIFLCRNSSAPENLRTELCNNMIPYIEKLYKQILNEKENHQMSGFINLLNCVSWHNTSKLYH